MRGENGFRVLNSLAATILAIILLLLCNAQRRVGHCANVRFLQVGSPSPIDQILPLNVAEIPGKKETLPHYSLQHNNHQFISLTTWIKEREREASIYEVSHNTFDQSSRIPTSICNTPRKPYYMMEKSVNRTTTWYIYMNE